VNLPDRQADATIVVLEIDPHCLARRGVLHSVVEKVPDRACKCLPIGVNGDLAGGAGEQHFVPLLPHAFLKGIDGGTNERGRIHALEGERIGALEPPEIEQVLDEPPQPLGLADEHAVGLPSCLLRHEPIRCEHLSDLIHRRERSAELVGHCRHEIGLQAGDALFPSDGPGDDVAAGNHHERDQRAERQEKLSP
jgi:hypothetical protein